MDEETILVNFEKYCKTCKHYKVDEVKDPCNECLDSGANRNTDKPVLWEKKE